MQAFDLTRPYLELHKMRSYLEALKPKEFAFLRLQGMGQLEGELLKLVEDTIAITSEMFLSIPIDDYEPNLALVHQLMQKGLKGLCLRCKTNPEKFAGLYNMGAHQSGDRDLLDYFAKLKSITPEMNPLTAEFEIEEDSRMMGSTISNLHLAGMPWVTIRLSSDPNPKEVLKMRSLFEFLRMRRCYKLNVYFDFTHPTRVGWQIQSMNTFSGIRDVHIDISNRCTHSCVFCGLYGPQAIQELQNKGEGKISPEVKNFMRMEIDSEKALSIIKELPYDVHMIQFGGAGDPLMHEYAVRFIAAARERGFAVEVLSNMEYLEPEDLNLLTQLGSADQYSLNFIANVSGGTYEVYHRTRPKQSEKAYDKIVNNIKGLTSLRRVNNNVGATLTLMCVVNKWNIDGLIDVAKLAINSKVHRVWFKPMELHSEIMRVVLPEESDRKKLAEELTEALRLLDEAKIFVMQRDFCERIIEQQA